jgi:hypothetical protein
LKLLQFRIIRKSARTHCPREEEKTRDGRQKKEACGHKSKQDSTMIFQRETRKLQPYSISAIETGKSERFHNPAITLLQDFIRAKQEIRIPCPTVATGRKSLFSFYRCRRLHDAMLSTNRPRFRQ